MINVDIMDVFYQIHLNPRDILHLGVVFPALEERVPLVAFPFTLPMGWINSPPLFMAVTETLDDLTNQAFHTNQFCTV